MVKLLRKIGRWVARWAGLAPSQCNWVWLGDIWVEDGHNCPSGSVCTPPAYRGTYIGQTAATDCVLPP